MIHFGIQDLDIEYMIMNAERVQCQLLKFMRNRIPDLQQSQ